MSQAAKPLDLRIIENSRCRGGCSKEDRKACTENDLCSVTASEMDGLKIRCVGSWGQRKIHYLVKYFGIFTVGMHKIWKGDLNYLELCSGPGRCVFRESKAEVDGTALAIMNDPCFKHIKTATFIDFNDEVVSVLNERITNANKNDRAVARIGDYNNFTQIKQIMGAVPKNSLNMMLIDPTDCSLPFETIRIIKRELERVDLIINVPIFSDVGRNVSNAVLDPDKYKTVIEKYTRFIGDRKFLFEGELVEAINRGENLKNIRMMILNKYYDQLRKIGYQFFNHVVVERNGVNLYYLLFASADERGLDFWNKISLRDDLGQTSLNFFGNS